jgi:trk system potassium uptake protein TrkH
VGVRPSPGERLDAARWAAHKALGRVAVRVRRAWLGVSAPALLVLGFLAMIVLGTCGLLWLPGLQAGPRLGLLDAVFTMTSAVCITGLVVVDTATYFTRAGQLWILLFVQLGGLGLLTLTTLVIGALGRRLSLRSEMLSAAPVDFGQGRPLWSLAWTVLRYTLVAEGVGALVLFLLWLPRFGAAEAAWHAVFQAVNGFCNAGFTSLDGSLTGFVRSPLTLLTMSALIVAGGLGFLSTEELVAWWKARGRKRRRLSVHTWAVVWVTGILLVGGFGAYLLAEWNGVLADLSPTDRVANAWLMSATARSAGFNAVDYGQLSNSGVLVTLLLMGVGGSPGSTAGGMKTTTLAVLAALAWARFSGRRHTLLHGRTVPAGTVQRTVSVVLLMSVILLAAIFLMGVLESRPQPLPEARQAFLPVVFEVVSALSTVGLSMGQTPELNPASRALTILLMFIGRVGPLVFFAAISLQGRARGPEVREAAEDLVVG